MTEAQKRSRSLVLVVDDDLDIRETLTALLDMKGCDTVSAGNGREALEYLEANETPDVIILDLWMPVMNGFQFRSEQLKNTRFRQVPLVVVTALSDRAEIDADRILIKPVEVETLLTTLTADRIFAEIPKRKIRVQSSQGVRRGVQSTAIHRYASPTRSRN
jgi:CheY-like chemotaxis protein